MTDWRARLLTRREQIEDVLERFKIVAVVGIKPEDRASQPAHNVPAYMQAQGYTIIPVPTYYPEVTEILGEPVYRDLRDIPPEAGVEVVNLFRRSDDVSGHVDEILAMSPLPKVVWMQRGIRNEDAAERFAKAGIDVIQDHCMLADHIAMARS
jgi:predicted CoA-binding protein